MYLLYLDQSGDPKNTQDHYVVLGGIALFERKVFWVNEALDDLAQHLFGSNNDVELKAQAINSHKHQPWHNMPSSQREAVLADLCEIASQQDLVLFGVAIEKTFCPDPVGRAFEEICNRFDLFLKRLHAQENTQRGLIIMHRSKYEPTLRPLLANYRNENTRFGQVKNFADVPCFADDQATRMLQLSHMVSYAIYRRYERSNTSLLDQLIFNFDAEGGVIHGLVHLTRNAESCYCPSCLTRARRLSHNRA
ncbi:MAG: DUF3800 domain-containing protein [Nitrospinaceae bacterium]